MDEGVESADSPLGLTFDADKDWPAPGWSFGFGKLLFPNLLIDADNTRHYLTWSDGVRTPGGYVRKGRLSAGSMITIECHNCGKTGVEGEAIVTYPDGHTVKYNSLGADPYLPTLYPTEIVDPNGNYSSIEYLQDVSHKPIPPLIQKITDTVGRVVLFHYDSANKLTAITGPDLSGTQRIYARFFYSTHPVDVRLVLANGRVVARRFNHTALSTIYFPGNNSAFVLTDYQRHGVPREIQERRAVLVETPTLNTQGTILSLGSLSRSIQFAFTNTYKFSEPPRYFSKTERWSDPVSGQDRTAVTKFDLVRGNNFRSITVTYPDGSTAVQVASEAPGRFDQGLVYLIQRKSSQGRFLSTAIIQWELGTYGIPRQKEVKVFDEETRRQTKTAFRYGQNGQQIVEEIHYGYGTTADDGPVLWKKRTDYLDDARYTQRNILNLPKSVTYFDGDSAVPSMRTDYEYDGVQVASIPDVTNHLIAFDPIGAGSTKYCSRYEYKEVEATGDPTKPPKKVKVCVEYKTVSRYKPDVQGIRGNVTSIRRYSNASQAPGLITTNFRYDSAGNLIAKFNQADSTTEYLYDASTQFSMPTRISSGSPNPSSTDRISSTFQYNRVGLLRSVTDPGGRTATYEYIPGAAGWRLSKLVRANESSYSRTYMDDSLSLKASVAGTPGGPTLDVLADFDGRGRLRKTTRIRPVGPNHIQGVEYDDMGRIHRQSRPYADGTTASWITNSYDDAGRLIKVSAADGSDTKYFYNEPTAPDSVVRGEAAETLRVEDPWGRSRWINYDEQHNIRGVVEPNPSGSGNVFEPGSLLTRYYFNPFGQLKQSLKENKSGFSTTIHWAV